MKLGVGVVGALVGLVFDFLYWLIFDVIFTTKFLKFIFSIFVLFLVLGVVGWILAGTKNIAVKLLKIVVNLLNPKMKFANSLKK